MGYEWLNPSYYLEIGAMRPTKTGWWFGTCFIFPYIGLLIIPIDSYFSEGWPNHQPENHVKIHQVFLSDRRGPGRTEQLYRASCHGSGRRRRRSLGRAWAMGLFPRVFSPKPRSCWGDDGWFFEGEIHFSWTAESTLREDLWILLGAKIQVNGGWTMKSHGIIMGR